ncbi:MAG: hypothetical protein LBF51_10030 [Zoogloeaceae bacterium]|nr:hypothetical protein [Zoogloeaceae bacterium]
MSDLHETVSALIVPEATGGLAGETHCQDRRRAETSVCAPWRFGGSRTTCCAAFQASAR